MWDEHKKRMVRRHRVEQVVIEGFSIGICLLAVGIMLMLAK